MLLQALPRYTTDGKQLGYKRGCRLHPQLQRSSSAHPARRARGVPRRLASRRLCLRHSHCQAERHLGLTWSRRRGLTKVSPRHKGVARKYGAAAASVVCLAIAGQLVTVLLECPQAAPLALDRHAAARVEACSKNRRRRYQSPLVVLLLSAPPRYGSEPNIPAAAFCRRDLTQCTEPWAHMD